MDNSERLYTAVLQMDFETADRMISEGAALDGDIRDALVKGPSGAANFNKRRYEQYYRFSGFAAEASIDDFSAVAEKLFELVGEPLYNTFGEYRYSSSYRDKFYDPKFFETLLKCFSGKQMRKQATMQEIINKNDTGLLALCAKYGWLKMPHIRDAMISYANEKNSTECTAFLLDFKNRTADLAKERENAEKKMLRELNANPDPNSVAELKKIWKYEKRADGTLIITGYKGDERLVTIPEKIGKSTVTAIGELAFSPKAPRLTYEKEMQRVLIEKIIVPPTVKTIGRRAFGGYAFDRTKWRRVYSLPEVVLPPSLDIFGSRLAADESANIFDIAADGITAVIPRLENAEYYCKKNKIPYRFDEEKI